MDETGAHNEPSAILTEYPRYSPDIESISPRLEPLRIPPLNIVLFLLTFLTTSMAGGYMAGAMFSVWHPFATAGALSAGFSFSIPLMLILFAHEMGHFVTARRNRVDTSLPYFLPVPPSVMPIGTFGAVIRLRQIPRTRRVMFDIGAAGPWAGFILSVPILIIGLALSQVGTQQQLPGTLQLGSSLLVTWLSHLVLHADLNSVNIIRSPIAFAGWLGLFVTTLNLLPVGQFDGGHVVYALFGRHHRTISRLFVLGCILMAIVPYLLGLDFWAGWLLWAGLAFILGLGHPSTIDEHVPLDARRRLLAWATIAVFIVTFCPVPVSLGAPPQPEHEKLYTVSHVAPQPELPHPHLRLLGI